MVIISIQSVKIKIEYFYFFDIVVSFLSYDLYCFLIENNFPLLGIEARLDLMIVPFNFALTTRLL